MPVFHGKENALFLCWISFGGKSEQIADFVKAIFEATMLFISKRYELFQHKFFIKNFTVVCSDNGMKSLSYKIYFYYSRLRCI